MWWGRNRRRKSQGIRSLVERLKALEDATDRPSSTMSAVGQAVHTKPPGCQVLKLEHVVHNMAPHEFCWCRQFRADPLPHSCRCWLSLAQIQRRVDTGYARPNRNGGGCPIMTPQRHQVSLLSGPVGQIILRPSLTRAGLGAAATHSASSRLFTAEGMEHGKQRRRRFPGVRRYRCRAR
jgi:hypothetical protein